mmetsp:Transcript_25290/g.66597  ORF Transcript_25290/g.66597 Transcript_25290/m.66597 type:complete len:229 (-) Transcript_25290:584-1270(-)
MTPCMACVSSRRPQIVFGLRARSKGPTVVGCVPRPWCTTNHDVNSRPLTAPASATAIMHAPLGVRRPVPPETNRARSRPATPPPPRPPLPPAARRRCRLSPPRAAAAASRAPPQSIGTAPPEAIGPSNVSSTRKWGEYFLCLRSLAGPSSCHFWSTSFGPSTIAAWNQKWKSFSSCPGAPCRTCTSVSPRIGSGHASVKSMTASVERVPITSPDELVSFLPPNGGSFV